MDKKKLIFAQKGEKIKKQSLDMSQTQVSAKNTTNTADNRVTA